MKPAEAPALKKWDPLPDTRPFTLAAAYLHRNALAEVVITDDGRGGDHYASVKPTKLRHWREEYYQFNGCTYERLEIETLHADVNDFLNGLTYFGKGNLPMPLSNNEGVIKNVFGQLKRMCQARVLSMPAWLDAREVPLPKDVIAFQNGLLDITEWIRDPDSEPMKPTPQWFSTNVLSCKYSRDAGCGRWLRFLDDSLERNAALISLLQEWFGYCLTSDTSLQKLLWLHGVSGAGKSTVTSILQRVIGARNVVRFDLWDLASTFGLSPFLGKRVAISADAHLGHSTESDKVLAKLKQISGDDETSVNRKNKEILESIKLTTRFVICTNEFPTLSDAADAITRRAMFIPFNKSFVGIEDTNLVDRLSGELPGITMWAMEGLARLMQRGKFEATDAGNEVRDQFRRLQSPVHAFVEDCCEICPYDEERNTGWVRKDDIYKRFSAWAKENERNVMSKDRFATKLFRVVPGLEGSRPRDDGGRMQVYRGIILKEEEIEIP